MSTVAPDILRHSQLLKSELRDCCLWPHFQKPLWLPLTNYFKLLRLGQDTLKCDGADDFFGLAQTQGHKIGTQWCRTCFCKMRRIGPFRYKCQNPQCRQHEMTRWAGRPTQELTTYTTPVRGIVWQGVPTECRPDPRLSPVPNVYCTECGEVMTRYQNRDVCTNRDCERPVDGRETRMVQSVILRLDRQYERRAREKLFRRIGAMCEHFGCEVL